MDKKLSPEFSRLISFITDALIPLNEEEEKLKKYIKLILVIAKKYIRPGVEYEDLIMEGVFALIESVRKFDPKRSSKFSNYAITRIKGQMFKYFINNNSSLSIPGHIVKVKSSIERITKILNREPSVFNSGISPQDVILVKQHDLENKLSKKAKESVARMKSAINKIALDAHTTYETIVELAYSSCSYFIEICDWEKTNTIDDTLLETSLETNVIYNEILNGLYNRIGPKKTAILALHHRGYNNEDIADEIYEKKIVDKRISRQAVKGALQETKLQANKYVKRRQED